MDPAAPVAPRPRQIIPGHAGGGRLRSGRRGYVSALVFHHHATLARASKSVAAIALAATASTVNDQTKLSVDRSARTRRGRGALTTPPPPAQRPAVPLARLTTTARTVLTAAQRFAASARRCQIGLRRGRRRHVGRLLDGPPGRCSALAPAAASSAAVARRASTAGDDNGVPVFAWGVLLSTSVLAAVASAGSVVGALESALTLVAHVALDRESFRCSRRRQKHGRSVGGGSLWRVVRWLRGGAPTPRDHAGTAGVTQRRAALQEPGGTGRSAAAAMSVARTGALVVRKQSPSRRSALLGTVRDPASSAPKIPTYGGDPRRPACEPLGPASAIAGPGPPPQASSAARTP